MLRMSRLPQTFQTISHEVNDFETIALLSHQEIARAYGDLCALKIDLDGPSKFVRIASFWLSPHPSTFETLELLPKLIGSN